MVIGEEARSAALLLASMRVTETESLSECREPKNRQQSENIVLCDQETHFSTLISMKVGDRNLTILETNGVDSRKGQSSFPRPYYCLATKRVI